MTHHLDTSNTLQKNSRLTICDEIVASPDRLDTLDYEDLRLSFHDLCQHQFELESQNEGLRHAQAELEVARTRYFNLYDMAPVGYCILDQSDNILDVNGTAALMLDTLKDQVAGQPFSRYVHAEDRVLYRHHLQKVRYGNGPMVCELRMRKADGSVFWAQLTATMQRTGQNHEIQAVICDMTERKLNEEALQQSERNAQEAKNLLKLVLDTIPIRLFWKDIQSTYLGCNVLFARDAGFETPEELIGLDDCSITWREQAEIYRRDDREIITLGVPKLASEEILTAPDGRQRWLSISKVPLRDDDGNVIGILGSYEDITRQKQMEGELPKAEKLESLALLAGGIAHEFNNIMMTIMGNVSMVQQLLPPTHAALDRLAKVEASVLKTKELIQGFLAFATNSLPYRKSFSAVNLIDTYCRLTLSGTNSTYTCKLAIDLWPIEADVGQIGQALVSVLAYASEGVAEKNIIVVQCENMVVTPDDPLPLKSGNYLQIKITSMKKEIPEERVRRLFDPTLTSEERGSTLGLAGAYASLVRNDGYLAVASTPGKGSEFTLYLPAAAPLAPIETVEEGLESSRGKILVMDDDELVCNILESMLQRLGHTSEAVFDGEEALAKYAEAKENGAPFDAVIMDLIIAGGMGGRETTEKLLLFDPQAKVIVSSGYINNSIMRGYRQHGFSDVMEKPYRLSKLRQTLQRVLASKDVASQPGNGTPGPAV